MYRYNFRSQQLIKDRNVQSLFQVMKPKLYVSPWLQCRHRGKINIKKPRPGPIERQVMAAITQPILPEMINDPTLTCSEMQDRLKSSKTVVNEYKKFMVTECRKIFQNNRMVVVLQPKPLTGNESRQLKNDFIKIGMDLSYDYPVKVLKDVVDGTKWSNMSCLFIGNELLAFSQDDCIKQCFQLAKKTSQFDLLACLFDDRLLSYAEVQYYADLPGLPNLHESPPGVSGEEPRLFVAEPSNGRRILINLLINIMN
ncbi:hypothetical protein CAPTEDRAFT_223105, partial [Capitella teleta]